MIKDQIVSRFAFVYVAVSVIAALIVLKILYLQVFEHKKWTERAQALTFKDMIIEPNRGDIYSVSHQLLATSVPYYEIRMDMRSEALTREHFLGNVDSLSMYLAGLFGDKSGLHYKKALKEAYDAGNRYYLLQRRVNYRQLKELKHFPILRRGRFKGGLIVIQENTRNKPFQSLASRTLGRLRNKGETRTVVGLEGAYERELHGREGIRLMRKLTNNVWMPMNDANEVDPENGIDIVSTIDVNIQDITERALLGQLQEQKAHHGTAIVMEVATGEIRAIANLRIGPDSVYREYYNYAVGESTEPGSTFKLASLLVAMEDNKLRLNDTVHTHMGVLNYYGFEIKDSKDGGHGLITAQQAFELSSNVGIARLIERYYGQHPEQFVARLYNMGLNQKLGIELAGEGEPYIKYTNDKFWTRVSLPQMAIGYELKLTPLQILAFYNAIANDGKLLKPLFVKAFEAQGRVIKTFEPVVLNPSIASQNSIRLAKQLLEGVVEHGTAQNIKASRYRIAGKTGTAKIFDQETKRYVQEYKASFVGYFPARSPKYSCFVMISAPKTGLYYGNTVAAPVFKEIADNIYLQEIYAHRYELKNTVATGRTPYTKSGHKTELNALLAQLGVGAIAEKDFQSEWAVTSIAGDKVLLQPRAIDGRNIPNVMGMSAKDALYVLENLGLRVKLIGRGAVVRQFPMSGNAYRSNQVVQLELN